MNNENILIRCDDDQSKTFKSAKDFFFWLTTVTNDLSEIRNFLDGGFVVDSSDNRYYLDNPVG